MVLFIFFCLFCLVVCDSDMYPVWDKDLLNTLYQARTYFQNNFDVNMQDSLLGLPGTLIGRYKDDVYPGCSANGGTKNKKK